MIGGGREVVALKVKHSQVAQVVTKFSRISLAARARAEVFDFSSGCNPYLFIDRRALLKHRSFLSLNLLPCREY